MLGTEIENHPKETDGLKAIRLTLIDLIAGALGATASVYVGQPLDTVKVKMQTFPHLYPNPIICFKETFRKDGIRRGLYAGTLPSLAANVAENSILFAAYGRCQSLVATMSGVQKTEDLSTVGNGFAGFIAAFFSSLALCPTELVKCRLQAMRESYIEKGLEPPKISPFALTRQIFASDGFGGFFHGFRPTLVREMPGYFFFFCAYEFTREKLRPEGKTKDEIGPLRTIVSGGVAGFTLWTLIFPFDVIKSRQQVAGSSEPMMRYGFEIYKREGLAALYNGLTPTLFRTIPATGALFFAYEYSKKWMIANTGGS